MTLPIRFAFVALAGFLIVVASAMLPSDPSDIAGVEAAPDTVPPLHMSVPTTPYTG